LLLPSCVIRVGVHNWTDLSREKPHAAGLNHVAAFLASKIRLLYSQTKVTDMSVERCGNT
jgi:hypothetical protein